MKKLGTTTWRNRNYHRLDRTKKNAFDLGLYHPVIIDFGPGGVVNFLLDYLPKGDKDNWTNFLKIRRGILKLTETLIRKTNLFQLETSEPKEIAYLFNDLEPQIIYVVDIEPKVIGAVRRMISRNGLNIHIECVEEDITKNHLYIKGDIVIAYNVIQKTNYPKRSLEVITNSVNKGGLLSITLDEYLDGFNKLESGLYIKL